MSEIERHADQFAERFTPISRDYESILGELASMMAKWCTHTGDYERARKYHNQLRSVDPGAAAELANDVMSPQERRLRSKLEAQRSRREALAKLQQEEALEEFRLRMRRRR